MKALVSKATTPRAQAFWAKVRKAAESAPEHVRAVVEKAARESAERIIAKREAEAVDVRNPVVERVIDGIARELTDEAWDLGDSGWVWPEDDSMFKRILRRHIGPLLGESWKAARIVALRSELEAMEAL